MYFYNTISPGELGESHPGSCVCICEKCGKVTGVRFNKCEIVTDEYVKLKDGIEIVCEKCGNKAEQVIPYRPLEEPAPQPTSEYVPKCPICHSPRIHRIPTSKKISRAVMFGVFALPKMGKEWHCDNCGSEF